MPTYQVINIIDGEPTFEVPIGAILSDLKAGGALKTLTPVEYHTAQQRKWYRGICLRGLSDWSGDTVDEWDHRLKMLCNGIELLKTETFYHPSTGHVNRLTIKGVCKKNLTQFIQNILSIAVTNDWPVTPPDENLRR